MARRTASPLKVLAPWLLLVLATGCGPARYAVTGRVSYENGSPVEGGTVIGEAVVDGKVVGVQGNIEPNGHFQLGATKPGDGALPGHYRILVMPIALGDSELAAGKRPGVDSKYSKFESSGFTCDVTSGKNVLNLVVTKPQPKQRNQ
jgi:hypothetical protein